MTSQKPWKKQKRYVERLKRLDYNDIVNDRGSDKNRICTETVLYGDDSTRRR